MPRQHAFVRLVALTFLIGCSSAAAATLAAAGQTANPGQLLFVPLTFTASGASISGIQFDMLWDSSLSLSVTDGAQLRASTKSLYCNLIGGTVLRCVIVGINNADQLPDGAVLNLLIGVNPAAAAGTANIQIVNVLATTPIGEPAIITAGPVSVQIQGTATPQLPVQSILNAASLLSGPVSPGEIISLFAPIGTGTPAVFFNGSTAPILYAGSNQVNAIVPFGLDVTQPVAMQLMVANQQLGAAQLATAAATPAVFALSGQGVGPGAILNQDYSLNSATNPAPRGSVIMLYGTGFGLVNGAVTDGAIENTATSFAQTVTATISGVPAVVQYAGSAPGLVAGAAQINVLIPTTIQSNLAAPVVLTVGSASTPTGITVAIR
jgi:uncharacterized protein (TIGR03437 family)